MAGIDIASQNSSLMWGQVALAACTVLYLAWWWVFFNPQAPQATGARYALGVACIVGAVVFGLASIVLMGMGVGGLAAVSAGAPVWAFAVGGVAAYVVLALATTRLFGRPVTTELMLFVLWCALELAVLDVLHGAGALSAPVALALAVLVVAVTIACLVCYVLYFRLAPMPSFVAGAAPLAAVGVVAAVLAVVIARL